MNVVRHVAERVRRQTVLFRSGSSAQLGQALFVDPKAEPYKYSVLSLGIYNLTANSTATVEEKINAISRIGHYCWTGGPSTSNFAAQRYFAAFANILGQDEPAPLKLQVVKSLSEMCRDNQELVREHNFITLVIEFMVSTEDRHVRQWCFHTLFFLIIGDQLNQVQALNHLVELKECILEGMQYDWSTWTYNEAVEVSKALNIEVL